MITIRKSILLLLALFTVAAAEAGGDFMAKSVADTSRVVDVEEAVVVASPKETSSLRRQPLSVSVFGRKDLELRGVRSVKGLSVSAPGFFMPDYGSRITSAVYIRGIGSRMNTPAVGLYVDNVPYVDKSAYDFAFIDIARVDVLRGPQATLYGRNTMGGLVRVFTADPLVKRDTEVRLGVSGRNTGRTASFSTALQPLSSLGISLSGYYEGENGFFRNQATGKHADASEAGGGRLRLAWRPSEAFRADLSASYEYSDENACPYFLEDEGSEQTGRIAQNRQSQYRRGLLNTGLGLAWKTDKIVLSSNTSFQHLRDRLFMDQDFTAADIFSLEQKQRIGTLTEELTLKSRPGSRWQWTSGAFFMYQNLTTDCPVTFYADGVGFLNRQFAAVLPNIMGMSLALTDNELPFNARLETPTTNAALFHQSTVKLGGGLSLSAGLRWEYDYRELRLDAPMQPVNYRFAMQLLPQPANLSTTPSLAGKLHDDTWQLLPKFALQYDHKQGRGNVYLSVAKGYRSGGYNIQAYSDLSQTALRRGIMLGVKDFALETINKIPMKEEDKQKALAGMNAALAPNIPGEPSIETLAYKPEQSWNYELGGHLNFADGALLIDYTFFLMDTHDQQLARFADSGMGRVMVNAGKSRSYGAEISARAALLDNRLTISAGYGYTHAAFTNYDLGESKGQRVDYTDNRVPFVPEHTVNLVAAFRQPLDGGFFKAIGGSIDLSGVGKIWWDEANTYGQDFYALLGARFTAEMAGNVSVTAWGKNLTQTDYNTFSFESLGRRFSQRGTPVHFGVDVAVKF